MLAQGGVNGLSATLVKCLEQRDLNAACGVLRRLLSEVTDSDHAPSSSSLRNSPAIDMLINAALATPPSAVAAHRALKPISYSVLAHVSQRCDRWEAALVFAKRMPNRPDASFVANLLTSGNWQYINRVRVAHRWQWHLPMALERLGSVGAWDDALALAMACERHPDGKKHRRASTTVPSTSQHTVGVLVTLLAQRSAANWATALRVFNEGFLSGMLTHPDVLMAVLRSCAASGRWHVALGVASMLDQTHQLHGVNDPLLFQQLVALSPGWREALELFERMRLNGVVPNQRTVELLLARCDNAGAWEAATHVFDSTRADGLLHTIDGAASYKALVRSFHLTAQWERALEALSWMGHASDAAAASGMVELVELSERSGQWDVALQVGAQLFDATILPVATDGHTNGSGVLKSTVPLASSTYLSLAFACAAGRQWATSIALYAAQLHDHRITPHPLAACSVLQACLATRDAWVHGLRFFAQVHAAKPRVVLPPLGLSLAMKLCVERQRWHDALQLLDIMHVEGLPLDNHGQKLGLWASALCGSWQASLRHYRRIPKHNRSHQDTLVVRGATKHSGPLATALVMRHLAMQ